MIVETARRVLAIEGVEVIAPVVMGAQQHRDLIVQTFRNAGLSLGGLVLEPCGRNTAPAALAAATFVKRRWPDALVLLMPADHVVDRPERLVQAVSRAASVARRMIVTFGIRPDRAETGFGYIACGEEVVEGVHCVEQFLEKPDVESAARYVAGGRHLWNAGLFLFAPEVLIEEAREFCPAVLEAASASVALGSECNGELSLDRSAFEAAPSVSIDYAIMEPTRRAAVAPCDPAWGDVGSWCELWRMAVKDPAGNAVSNGVVLVDASRNLVRTGVIPTALVGVDDLVVVLTPDGLLVAGREHAQRVREAVERLRSAEREPVSVDHAEHAPARVENA